MNYYKNMLQGYKGGFSLSSRELGNFYQRGLTFIEFVENFFYYKVPQFYQNQTVRNPGVCVMGYLLDFFYIMNPKIVSFKDGVEAVVQVMRGNYINFLNPFAIGRIVNDAEKMRIPSEEQVFDPFISPVEVMRFDFHFSELLQPHERGIYNFSKNFMIPPQDIVIYDPIFLNILAQLETDQSFPPDINTDDVALMVLGTTLN